METKVVTIRRHNIPYIPPEVYNWLRPLSLLGLFWNITSLYIRGKYVGSIGSVSSAGDGFIAVECLRSVSGYRAARSGTVRRRIACTFYVNIAPYIHNLGLIRIQIVLCLLQCCSVLISIFLKVVLRGN